MKHLFSIVIASLLLMACATSESASDKARKKAEMAAKISEGVQTKHFNVNIDKVYPMGHGTIHPSTLYSVTVKDDYINSYLPYFGRAYNVPYGGGSGLNFEGKVLRYQETIGKKGEHYVVLDVESKEDLHQYSFVIFDNGKVTLDVISKERNPISFSGYVNLDEE
jgi:hypothetical protein